MKVETLSLRTAGYVRV